MNTETNELKPLVSNEERKLLLDRWWEFYGDAERVVWDEHKRLAYNAMRMENA